MRSGPSDSRGRRQPDEGPHTPTASATVTACRCILEHFGVQNATRRVPHVICLNHADTTRQTLNLGMCPSCQCLAIAIGINHPAPHPVLRRLIPIQLRAFYKSSGAHPAWNTDVARKDPHAIGPACHGIDCACTGARRGARSHSATGATLLTMRTGQELQEPIHYYCISADHLPTARALGDTKAHLHT